MEDFPVCWPQRGGQGPAPYFPIEARWREHEASKPTGGTGPPAEKTEDPKVLKEGMELIYQKINKIMESLGVKKIKTNDADFDTNYHEAVAMVPGMGDDKKGKVLDCVQTGYTLNDKVIRHAKVAVGQ